MSRAFVREDDRAPDAPLPPDDEAPAPVTPAGMSALRARLTSLASDPARAAHAAHLARRLTRLTVVDAPPADPTRVAFGAVVTVAHDDGAETTWRLVGPDETDLHDGGVSVTSPVARALLGRREGDEVRIVRPRGATEVTVLSVRYLTPMEPLP